MSEELDDYGLREWANGYRDAEGMDQHRRASALRLLAERDRLAAAQSVVEDLEGALRRISYMTYGDLLDPTEPWHSAMERIARDALASLPSPEPTQGEQ